MGDPARGKIDRHMEKMEALRTSLESLNRAPAMADAYGVAVTSIMRMLGCERASVLRFGRDGRVHFVAWEGLSANYREAVAGHCPWQQAEVDAEPILVTDIAQSDLADDLKAKILAEGIRAVAFFPMISGVALLGKYMAYYHQPHCFSPEEINFGKILAHNLVATLNRLENVEKLELSERRLALVLDSVDDCLWDWNIATDDVYYSPRWEEILGYKVGTFGKERAAWEALVHRDDLENVQSVLNAHLAGDVPCYEVEYRLLAREGNWVWVLDRGKVVERSASGRPLRAVGTHTDISRRKFAEIEKEKMQRQLEHTQRLESLGVLAGGIAHDFNNILTVILGTAGLAAREELDDPTALRNSIAAIGQAAQKGTLLCRQLLTYAGGRPVEVQPMDLSGLVRDLKALLDVAIDRSVTLAYDLGDQLPLVEADEAQLQQVIVNLVINASEAIGAGGGAVSVATRRAHLTVRDLSGLMAADDLQPGDFVLLELKDNGSGMSYKTKMRLFEPFFTTKASGRGLGMSAVLGIVRAHGAAIRVDSVLGEGTVFRLYFPQVKAAHDARVVVPASVHQRTAQGTVLLIDDDELIREVAQKMLIKLGFSAVSAGDGERGLEVFRRHHDEIAAVLLDVTLPGINGLDCLAAMRAIDPHVRVVLCSGYGEAEAAGEIRRGVAAERVGFLAKPYTPDDLAQALHRVLFPCSAAR